MSRKNSNPSPRPTKPISSVTVSKASNRLIQRNASTASHTLRDPNASKKSKSAAGSSMSQLSQVKKGGAAYHVRGIDVDTTVVSSATSVHTLREGATKYRKVLSRLAKK